MDTSHNYYNYKSYDMINHCKIEDFESQYNIYIVYDIYMRHLNTRVYMFMYVTLIGIVN